MTEDVKDYVKWLEIAEKDLSIAQYLNEKYYPTPHDIICYHAQQSIEKAMKAFFIYHREDYPKTHRLDYLKNGIEEKICSMDDMNDLILAKISRYEVTSRYPSTIQCDKSDSDLAIKYAEKYLQSIENKIIQDNMERLAEQESLLDSEEQQPYKIKI